MDQTALADQILFWNIGECGEEPDLDCSLSLRTDCHHQKGAWAGNRALHNSTDFESDPFRENAIGSAAYEKRLHDRGGRHE